MNTVIIDARSFKFLPEALEACRLSAVDTVVLTPNDLKLSTRYAGVLWAIQEGNMNLELIDCTNKAESIIDGIRAHAAPRDLVITDDIGVAAFAIREEAYAVDYRGRPFNPQTIEQDLKTRDHERLLRSMGFFPPCQNEPAPNADDAKRIARAIAEFASSAAPHEPQRTKYKRILVDADNLPTARILPVARSLGLPVSIFHDETNNSAPDCSKQTRSAKMRAWAVFGSRRSPFPLESTQSIWSSSIEREKMILCSLMTVP